MIGALESASAAAAALRLTIRHTKGEVALSRRHAACQETLTREALRGSMKSGSHT